MPYEIPTLAALAERTARAFRANIKGSDARLWPNNLAVTAKVIAGAVWMPYTFIEYISRQILVSTADGDWLDRHAADWGMARLPATFASGNVSIEGDPGVAIPAGVSLQRGDGLVYVTTASATTGLDGLASVPARATAAGRAGNAQSGVALVLMAPLDRIRFEATVGASGIGMGADPESDEALRARLLFRKRMPPHGGAAHDYVAWVREVSAGITHVFVDPVTASNARTSVGVWFLMADTYANGIPQTADVSAVRAYVETVRPAGAIVAVEAPTPQTVDITIDNLSPDTAAVRNAIATEIAAMWRREVRVSTATAPFTLYRSLIDEAIANATGEHHHTLVAPASDVTYATGHVPVVGTVSYV